MTGRIVEATEAQLARASAKYKGSSDGGAFKASDHGLAFVVLDDEDRIVGWCWGYDLLRPDGTTMVYVHEMEVDEDARRQGHGRRLIEAVIATARDREAGKVFLVTEKSNVSATALYRSAGAQTLDDGDSVVYWWSLDNDDVGSSSSL